MTMTSSFRKSAKTLEVPVRLVDPTPFRFSETVLAEMSKTILSALKTGRKNKMGETRLVRSIGGDRSLVRAALLQLVFDVDVEHRRIGAPGREEWVFWVPAVPRRRGHQEPRISVLKPPR